MNYIKKPEVKASNKYYQIAIEALEIHTELHPMEWDADLYPHVEHNFTVFMSHLSEQADRLLFGYKGPDLLFYKDLATPFFRMPLPTIQPIVPHLTERKVTVDNELIEDVSRYVKREHERYKALLKYVPPLVWGQNKALIVAEP
jgi:hypothetical protein